MWSKEDYDKVAGIIDESERDMIEMQRRITAVPALGPEAGGEGEEKKAMLLKEMLEQMKPDELQVIAAPDDRVPSARRPSVVARWFGENRDRTVWVMTHTDIVAPGNLELWNSDPYEVVEKDGRIYGRGVEDNQQSMVASHFAVKSMLKAGLTPTYNVGLIYVADEEVGSKYGIDYILKEHPDMIKTDDLVFVPDTGSEDGSMIEVAEKSILWMKATIQGKQSHASNPQDGNNALRAGAYLLTSLDEALHEKYPETDDLYSPPGSTFEPTKKDANVESVNIIPGEDVFYFDCRVLPHINLEDVKKLFRQQADKIEQRFDVRVDFESPQYVQAPPPTDEESEVVVKLKKAVKETRGIEARAQGIGGGTVASFFRRKDIPVAVWGTLDESMHQPNEYSKIANMIADCKVFAHIFGQE